MTDLISNLFGRDIPVTQIEAESDTRMMFCDACETHTRHERTPDGDYVCFCGLSQREGLIADERIMSLIEAVAMLIAGMKTGRRQHWIGLLIEALCDACPEIRQEMIDD